MKAAHHRGTYHVDSRRLDAAANANPDTRCWRCQRTLAELPRHKTGRKAKWTAGHINDREVGGLLRPECSLCACETGARSRGRNQTSRAW